MYNIVNNRLHWRVLGKLADCPTAMNSYIRGARDHSAWFRVGYPYVYAPAYNTINRFDLISSLFRRILLTIRPPAARYRATALSLHSDT